MKLFLRKIFITFSACSFAWMLAAQDIHFSQAHFSPLNISPGLTGMFDEDIRFMGSYRSQWESVPVPYLTFSGAADMKLPQVLPGMKDFQISGGILFNYDQAGESKLSLSSFGLAGAIAYRADDENVISFGASASMVQRSFDIGALTFNNQFNGDVFDPTLDPKEKFNSESVGFVDVGAGLSWRLRKRNSRSMAMASFGAMHVNRPNQSFNNASDAQLQMRFPMLARGIVEVHPKMDVIIQAIGQLQNPYEELVVGMASRYHLNTARGKEMAIQLGSYFRISDAVIPAIELHYTSWTFGMSYDINISEFDNATNGNGGIELGLIYTITNVKPIEVFESCPIF